MINQRMGTYGYPKYSNNLLLTRDSQIKHRDFHGLHQKIKIDK